MWYTFMCDVCVCFFMYMYACRHVFVHLHSVLFMYVQKRMPGVVLSLFLSYFLENRSLSQSASPDSSVSAPHHPPNGTVVMGAHAAVTCFLFMPWGLSQVLMLAQQAALPLSRLSNPLKRVGGCMKRANLRLRRTRYKRREHTSCVTYHPRTLDIME